MTQLFAGSGPYMYAVDRNWGALPSDWSFGIVSHVAVDSHDRVFVYQRGDPPVLVFDDSGALVGSWGEGAITDPHGMYIDATDDVYLVDRDEHEVRHYDNSGRLKRTIGVRGRPSFRGPFSHPADIALSVRGEIF